MSKPVNCGCGGNVDIHFIGNTYIGDYHKFTGKYFICCEKCGVKTPICKTREEAIEIWNKAMGERTAKATRNPQAFFYHCECGYALCCEKNDMNYCPSCGAKLDWNWNE